MIRNITRSREVEKDDDKICDEDGVDSGWWRNANLGECPITLECLSTLEYPPFALYMNNDNNSGSNSTSHEKVSAYFDGLALASYVVSRGVFQNPLTRADLTADDCRRLDRYLEDHCYNSYTSSSSGNNVSDNHKNYDPETKTMLTMMMGKRGGTKAISVAEAFALRNSVHVARSDGVNDNNNTRIQTLQNAATAALAGLFVYGNDRGSRGQRSANESDRQTQPRSDPFNEWGYDLSRRVEDTSTEGGHGYTVIDDDEAIVVASQRYVYEAVQDAFPPLSNETVNDTSYDGEPRNNNATVIDERLMERVRALSIQDQETKRRHDRELEQARKELLRQALERRRQKQKERIDRFARDTDRYQSQQKDEEELTRVGREIEAWKDDQWEKLRILSEERQSNEKISKSIIHDSCGPEDLIDTIISNDDEVAVIDNEMTTTAAAHERKKAKAAAKRKRAKERKKTQKSLVKIEAENLQREEAKEAKKAASILKCRSCGTGIPKLSMAFSRLDQLFCSSKCARTAVKLDST
ncbi:MAG: hypothetical protein ACI8RD_006790 [Bacillariaceae sp.]|jgi:hypothetical protein